MTLTSGLHLRGQVNLNRPALSLPGCIGAVFWNQPISAFYHGEDYDRLSDDEQRGSLYFRHGTPKATALR